MVEEVEGWNRGTEMKDVGDLYMSVCVCVSYRVHGWVVWQRTASCPAVVMQAEKNPEQHAFVRRRRPAALVACKFSHPTHPAINRPTI